MRRYKNLLPLLVHTEDGAYAQGEIFEKQFDSAADEAENLASGLLELQPLTYRVVGDSVVHDTQTGDTFEMALPMGQEELLVAGGHIELVEEKPAAKPKRTSRKADRG